jgi:mRNA interferase HigB
MREAHGFPAACDYAAAGPVWRFVGLRSGMVRAVRVIRQGRRRTCTRQTPVALTRGGRSRVSEYSFSRSRGTSAGAAGYGIGLAVRGKARKHVFHFWERPIALVVQVFAKRTLRLFWERRPRAGSSLRAWHMVVSRSQWSGPADLKAEFGTTVDFVGDNRLIFDIGGNRYRLIVHASYTYKRVLVKFVGNHAEYDKIDPGTV